MTDLFETPIISQFQHEFDFLSNFYLAPVEIWGMTFPSTEHAFQWAKTDDPTQKELILWNVDFPSWAHPGRGKQPTSPGQAKRRGRRITKRSDWDEVRYEIMTQVCDAKFQQHPELMLKLIATDPAILIEGNTWNDNTWGSCSCSGCANEPKLNWLGKILMHLRSIYVKNNNELAS